MKGEWRCVSMGCGELCVTVDGTPERPQWCASNLDTRTQVSEIIFKVSHRPSPTPFHSDNLQTKYETGSCI